MPQDTEELNRRDWEAQQEDYYWFKRATLSAALAVFGLLILFG